MIKLQGLVRQLLMENDLSADDCLIAFQQIDVNGGAATRHPPAHLAAASPPPRLRPAHPPCEATLAPYLTPRPCSHLTPRPYSRPTPRPARMVQTVGLPTTST